MSRRPGLKTYKNTEDTIKNDKEDQEGKVKILLVRHFAGTGGFLSFREQSLENSRLFSINNGR